MSKAEQVKGMYEAIEAWLMAWLERENLSQGMVYFGFLKDGENHPAGLARALSQCIEQINKVDGNLGKALSNAWGERNEDALALELDQNALVLGESIRKVDERIDAAKRKLSELIREFYSDGNLLFEGQLNVDAFDGEDQSLFSKVLGRMISRKSPYLYEGEAGLIKKAIEDKILAVKEGHEPYLIYLNKGADMAVQNGPEAASVVVIAKVTGDVRLIEKGMSKAMVEDVLSQSIWPYLSRVRQRNTAEPTL